MGKLVGKSEETKINDEFFLDTHEGYIVIFKLFSM